MVNQPTKNTLGGWAKATILAESRRISRIGPFKLTPAPLG
jgi:hypothetical protein